MNSNTIFLNPTNENEIKIVINNLKDQSGEVDNIKSRSLKVLSDIIAEPLSLVFNLCIESSVWPDSLKKAVIVPIYKSNDKCNQQNYRPISLISNVAKIFEKIIHDRLYNFISQRNLISENQFGFIRNKGREALSYISDLIYNNLDKNKPTIVTFLDLAKAFDTVVDHRILLEKLYCYGIRGQAHKLLESYLSKRLQSK